MADFCRVLYDEQNQQVTFESAKTKGLSLSQTIEDDKKYGVMKPANGKYFTWAVLNEDVEFNRKQIRKAVQMAQKRWRIYANTPKFKLVSKDYKGVIDFRIEFRTVESDPDQQLTENTIMYHYYPINDVNNPLRGLCVVNKKFFYTSHGNSVSGKFMMQNGVKVQFPDGSYGTIDFDVVYAHELGHGLGLPHDTEDGNMMSYRYDLMVEFPSTRDAKRMSADSKYGIRQLSAWLRLRWLMWLTPASDR